jgi:hypothetical protein
MITMRRLAALALVLAACGSDGPTGAPGTFTVSGTVRYEDRAQQPSGGLGAVTPKPARAIGVAVIAEYDDNSTIATGTTDDDGAYTLTFDGFEAENIHILAIASSTTASRPVAVKHAQTEDIHGFGGETFATDNVEHDVLITISSDAAEAFNIFDTLVDVMDRIPTLFPGRNALPLTAYWHFGNDDGTYYFENGLYLLGEEEDSDGFDDTVILHESGHWIEDTYGRSDSPGGDHDGSPTTPTLAWSEGFATYFAMAMTDRPIYADSNIDGGFAFNGDTSVTKANAVGPINQAVSEDMVTEILWDMGDAPADDDDQVAGTHLDVIKLQLFLRSGPLRSVVSGAELVDALDGWFINQGLTTCGGMRDILDVRHTFPYDYGGTAGACPP